MICDTCPIDPQPLGPCLARRARHRVYGASLVVHSGCLQPTHWHRFTSCVARSLLHKGTSRTIEQQVSLPQRPNERGSFLASESCTLPYHGELRLIEVRCRVSEYSQNCCRRSESLPKRWSDAIVLRRHLTLVPQNIHIVYLTFACMCKPTCFLAQYPYTCVHPRSYAWVSPRLFFLPAWHYRHT